MRVRVSYGVDLEELPEITKDLIDKAIEDLKSSIDSLERAKKEMDDSQEEFSTGYNITNKVRLRLNKADLTLSDVQYILEGLNNHYNGEKNVSERRPAVDSGRNDAKAPEDTGQG
tara:strand:- start:702 stop:1046 length:345 start_codon:yes stop_codon:yes gene_type:complete